METVVKEFVLAGWVVTREGGDYAAFEFRSHNNAGKFGFSKHGGIDATATAQLRPDGYAQVKKLNSFSSTPVRAQRSYRLTEKRLYKAGIVKR